MLDDKNAVQISIYYQNSRGLGSKHKRFFCTSSSYEYDIIILTETWLKKDILSAEFFDNSYAVYRKDRNIKRGGGVLTALNNETFASEQIDIPNTDNLEYVCINNSAKIFNSSAGNNAAIDRGHDAATATITTEKIASAIVQQIVIKCQNYARR